jgi:hypothetical protein
MDSGLHANRARQEVRRSPNPRKQLICPDVCADVVFGIVLSLHVGISCNPQC